MGYDITAYYDDEYAEMGRYPGWDHGFDNRLEHAEKIATLNSGFAEFFSSLDAEEYDAKVSGDASSRYYTRPQIIAGIEYVVARLRDKPHLGEALDFLVKILCRMNRAPTPENAVIFIWFC
jgi:hypothetical protein